MFPPAALGLIRKMTDRLDDIRVLITGAASGIGAACARRMARDGARLLLADLNGEGAKTLADELGQASVQVDVTRAADIEAQHGRPFGFGILPTASSSFGGNRTVVDA